MGLEATSENLIDVRQHMHRILEPTLDRADIRLSTSPTFALARYRNWISTLIITN